VAEDRARELLAALAARHLVDSRGIDRVGLHTVTRDYARQRAIAEDGPAQLADAAARLLGCGAATTAR
jgi:hypothetical protein